MPELANRAPQALQAFPALVAFGESKPHCATCGVRNVCLPEGLEPEAVCELERVVRSRIRVRKRSALFRHGQRFSALYAIRLGTFKTVALAEDGREQVTGYYIGGEIVGLDGVGDTTYTCDAIALEDGEVCVLPYEALDGLAADLPAFRHHLYRAISRDIRRAQGAMFMLGSMRAEERLATFLLDLSRRYQARGYSASEFVLRMTRDETASYLGLTLETVSRLFSRLQGGGLIQVQGRSIKLLDPLALRRLATRMT